MTAAEHGVMRKRGEVFGLLHAAEYPIYGRFGYGPATRTAMRTLDTDRVEFVGDVSGTVELVTPNAETRDLAKAAYETWRLREPASLRRRDVILDYDFGLRTSAFGDDWKGFLALHRDTRGGVDGYVRYRRTDDTWVDHQPRNTLAVNELMALTDGAYADLWRYLAEMDWVAKVKAEWRSPSEVLPWLLVNARAAMPSDEGDDLWVRSTMSRRHSRRGLMPAMGAWCSRSSIPRRVVAGSESARGLAGGRAMPAVHEVTELTLDVATLGAAYLGATPLGHASARFGGEEHAAGAADRLDRLMRTLDEPWCTTFF